LTVIKTVSVVWLKMTLSLLRLLSETRVSCELAISHIVVLQLMFSNLHYWCYFSQAAAFTVVWRTHSCLVSSDWWCFTDFGSRICSSVGLL